MSPATTASIRSKTRAIDWLYFVVVSAYLSAAMLYLLARGRLDPNVSWRRMIKGRFARRVRGALSGIQPGGGFCYLARVPEHLESDASGGRSRLRVYEDDRLLTAAHMPHDEIRKHGGGRYSHWGANVFFSATDNTDPRTNGRTYTFVG